MSKLILISGASSIVGKPLVSRLQEQGDKLIKISRHATDDDKYSCRWDLTTQKLSETSLVSKASMTKNVEGANSSKNTINTMIHCAPIWLLPDHLQSLIDLGIRRIIVFSSTSIDGKSESTSEHEQHIVTLLKDAEVAIWKCAKTHDVDVTIFRPTMIYGYGNGFNLAFIAKTIQSVRFFPVVIGARGLRQPVHADDLANATCLALPEKKSFGKTYVLSGAEIMSYEVMVRRIFMALDKKPKLIKLPLFVYRLLIKLASCMTNLPVDPSMADRMKQDLNFDNTSAKTDFRYSPMKFLPNGIKDILPIKGMK